MAFYHRMKRQNYAQPKCDESSHLADILWPLHGFRIEMNERTFQLKIENDLSSFGIHLHLTSFTWLTCNRGNCVSDLKRSKYLRTGEI